MPISYSLVHSPSGCNGEGWFRPQLGAGSPVIVSHLGVRGSSSLLAGSWGWGFNQHADLQSVTQSITTQANKLNLCCHLPWTFLKVLSEDKFCCSFSHVFIPYCINIWMCGVDLCRICLYIYPVVLRLFILNTLCSLCFRCHLCYPINSQRCLGLCFDFLVLPTLIHVQLFYLLKMLTF